MSFKWHPRDFQEVVRIVNSPSQAHNVIKQAISVAGSLSCPSPAWDPHGTYRVGVNGPTLVIQRLDHPTATWVQASLAPPASIVAAHPGQRVRARVGADVLEVTVVKVDESEFPGKVVVKDDVGNVHELLIHIGWAK